MVSPLYASVQGSNAFEEAVYFDISQKLGLGKSATLEEEAKKLAVANVIANTASIATFNAVRAPATVSASASLFSNLRTVQVVADSFNNSVKKASDLPKAIVSETAEAIQKKTEEIVSAPIQAGADVVKFAILALIIYLVVFRR